MSYAAINDVTKGLRLLLHSQLTQVSSTAVVSLLPPGDTLPEVSGVNLYLYRAAESPFARNQPWPGDRLTPPSNQPALSLQLHYLLTPLGTRPDNASFDTGDDAHTMLGLAMSTLHDNPVLNTAHLPGFDADAVLPPYLLDSYEQIKIMLSPVGLEELSKIWATINQPYRLSVAYEVSLVQITPTAPTVSGALVTRTGLDLFALQIPRIDSLSPASGALLHLDDTGALRSNSIVVTGSGFDVPGPGPIVTIGGQAVTIIPTSPPSIGALTVSLPADLDAGPEADVSVTVNGRAAASLPFIVTPWLSTVAPLRTDLPANQKLTLQGIGFTANPQGVRIDGLGAPAGLTAFDPGATDQQGRITVPPSLPNGNYRLRVVLTDAAESVSNSRALEIIPRIDAALLTPSSPPGAQTLSLTGARLAGNDIRLLLDGVTYRTPSNTNATQLNFTFSRAVTPGSHQLCVSVDGYLSHSVDLEA